MKETGICAKQKQMALVMIWHPFSHWVVCSEIVFSGCDFVFENITTLHLKSTEAGLYVENTSFFKSVRL